MGLGGAAAVLAYYRWRRTQQALRAGGQLPGARALLLLGGGLSVIAVVALVLVLASL